MAYDEKNERVKAVLGTFEGEKSTLHVTLKSYVRDAGTDSEKEGPNKVSLHRTIPLKKGGERVSGPGWLTLEEARWLGGILSGIPEKLE